MTPVERAALRLRFIAGPLGATPVQLADHATTLADCRIALAAAHNLDHNDPAEDRDNGETK